MTFGFQVLSFVCVTCEEHRLTTSVGLPISKLSIINGAILEGVLAYCVLLGKC